MPVVVTQLLHCHQHVHVLQATHLLVIRFCENSLALYDQKLKQRFTIIVILRGFLIVPSLIRSDMKEHIIVSASEDTDAVINFVYYNVNLEFLWSVELSSHVYSIIFSHETVDSLTFVSSHKYINQHNIIIMVEVIICVLISAMSNQYEKIVSCCNWIFASCM